MNRLDTVASLVQQNDILYDIGTDHAYLFLKVHDKITKGFAFDIAEKPLACARKTLAEHHLSKKVMVDLSNGLEKVDFSIATCISICGMGGELIVDILKPRIEHPKIRYLLQPMTKPEILRQYLYASGFVITKEIIAKEDRRYYTILECQYQAKPQNKPLLDCFVSPALCKDPLFADYILFQIQKLTEICRKIKNPIDMNYIYYQKIIAKLEDLC